MFIVPLCDHFLLRTCNRLPMLLRRWTGIARVLSERRECELSSGNTSQASGILSSLDTPHNSWYESRVARYWSEQLPAGPAGETLGQVCSGTDERVVKIPEGASVAQVASLKRLLASFVIVIIKLQGVQPLLT